MSDLPRMPLARARAFAEKIVVELAPFCAQIEIAGSIRRQRPDCGDVDIVCLPRDATAVRSPRSDNRPMTAEAEATEKAWYENAHAIARFLAGANPHLPEQVLVDLLDPASDAGYGHLELARRADLLLVAPATAATLARFAHGLADDLLSTLYLAFTGPVIVAPAMNCVPAWIATSAFLNVMPSK